MWQLRGQRKWGVTKRVGVTRPGGNRRARGDSAQHAQESGGGEEAERECAGGGEEAERECGRRGEGRA